MPNALVAKDGFTLEILYDCDLESPRTECDNLGKMVCFHNRHCLGDKHNIDHRDYNGWDEMEKAICRKEDVAVILPLFLYDHSGLRISTTSFNGRAQHASWDSGKVGFIYATKDAVRDYYGIKRITEKFTEKIVSRLINEVDTYDTYLSGDIYYFSVKDEDGEIVQSCGGFYGNDFENNGLKDALGEYAYLLA